MDKEEILEDGNTAIVPIQEQTVDFYGDLILAAQAPDKTIYVPLRALCDYLGLSWVGQRERITRNVVMAEALRSVRVTRTEAGGRRDVLCLPLDMLPGWLFGISAERVRPELRDKILRYQRECFRVLWDAFKVEILPAPAPPPTDLSGAALALEIATAVQHLARQQLDLETRLGDVAGRQEVMAEYLRGFLQENRLRWQQTEQRLTSLELQLTGGITITEAQAAEIALAVKNVGKALEGQGDRQGYAKVYSEMYRRYRISSYKNLPAARYQEVLDWLAGWYAELTKTQEH